MPLPAQTVLPSAVVRGVFAGVRFLRTKAGDQGER